MKRNDQKKGFTTIELLVVMAVIVTLAGILIPVYTNEMKMYKCLIDNGVTIATNAGMIQSVPFDRDECSSGHKDLPLNLMSNPALELVSDMPSTVNGGTGQNIGCLDGHVEFLATNSAGWMADGSTRDNMFTRISIGTSNGADTYIVHDGS